MTFDWKNPEYMQVHAKRLERIGRVRANPACLPALRDYYRESPAQFLDDWGMTTDPRNVERELPTTIPFLLFPRQRQWIEWVLERWKAQEPGITEKSRDSGLSWLLVALSCTLCLFNRGMVIGIGSRKEVYCDQLGSPKSLLEKARIFLSHLPAEFLGGWQRDIHAPHMRILFPGTGSVINAEAGDGIGRGDRASLYFIDESAFLERPELVDASLSATTNCRIDVSTVNGRGNPFAQKRFSGRIKVFTFHWRDEPRKGEDWYEKQVSELDPVTVASEIDIDYSGSIAGVLIPSAWVQAAVGAHLKLGITQTGAKYGGLDVADQGIDSNAMAFRHGFLLEHLSQWSGKGGDIYQSVVRALFLCEQYGYENYFYDADGLGAGVRGDSRRINADRKANGKAEINDEPFRSSSSPDDPNGEIVAERKNSDFFANLKAQAWWSLRLRFQNTYRAVVEGLPCNPDEMISIDPNLEELTALTMELSQPTYKLNLAGKVIVNKAPDGTRSPNLADAVMIAFNPTQHTLDVWMRFAGIARG